MPTNTTTLIGILINITANGIQPTSWVLTSQLPSDNNITFTLPTRADVNSGRNQVSNALDFQLILKSSGEFVIPRIMYKDSTDSYYGGVVNSYNAYTILAADIYGAILIQILDLSSLIDVVTSTGDGRIFINFLDRVTGVPNIKYFNTSLTNSTSTNLEIIYLTEINGKYYVGYVYGNNDVLMPMEANFNSVVSISILDSTLSGSSHPTTISILTTVV